MGTFAALVRKTALLCFVLGIFMLMGMDEMVEMIWGLFTRFEGVPDMSQAGYRMIVWSIFGGIAGLFMTLFAALIGSPGPGNPEQP